MKNKEELLYWNIQKNEVEYLDYYNTAGNCY